LAKVTVRAREMATVKALRVLECRLERMKAVA
jgi:hypothetical protein